MPNRFETAFLLGKTQGIFSNMFVGPRVENLLSCKDISELYKFYSGNDIVIHNEQTIIQDLETLITKQSIKKTKVVFDIYKKIPDCIKELHRCFEIDQLKHALIHYKKNEPFSFVELPYGTLHTKFWPNIKKVVLDTPYEWLISNLDKMSFLEIENRLDREYYVQLWSSCQKLPSQEKQFLSSLIKTECELQNVAWALRVKKYFPLHGNILDHQFISLSNEDITSSSYEILNTTSYSKIKSIWKWDFLTSNSLDSNGEINPVKFERDVVSYMYKKVRHAFHSHPLTVITTYCFIQLCVFEANLQKSVIEGFRLSMTKNEIKAILGDLAC